MPTTLKLTLRGIIMPESWNWFGDQIISLDGVQAQVNAASAFDSIELDLDTDGGVIEEGWRIYDYVLALGKPITKSVCSGIVASMGTPLMLMADERLMSPHAKFIVHQPSGGIEGNISDISEYLSLLELEQSRLLAVYAAKTGKDEAELSALLADGKDHTYTAQQALDYGWITGIYSGAAAPAAQSRRKPIMAHLSAGREALGLPATAPEKPINQAPTNPTINMSQLGKRLLAALGVAQAVAGGAPMKNLDVSTVDGTQLVIESTGDTYVIGDAVTIDGTPAPDGEHILSDGNTIVVADGIITDIIDATEEAVVEEATAAVASTEETVTISKAEYDGLKGLSATVASLEAKQAISVNFMTRMEPIMEALAKKESKSPVVASLPETPVDKRVPAAPTDDAVARKAARVASRN